jgi:hypothetical protein
MIAVRHRSSVFTLPNLINKPRRISFAARIVLPALAGSQRRRCSHARRATRPAPTCSRSSAAPRPAPPHRTGGRAEAPPRRLGCGSHGRSMRRLAAPPLSAGLRRDKIRAFASNNSTEWRAYSGWNHVVTRTPHVLLCINLLFLFHFSISTFFMRMSEEPMVHFF